MNEHPRPPHREGKRPTPHTEEHLTARGETGDDAPEIDEHHSTRRGNLEDAADAFAEDGDGEEGGSGPSR